LLPTRPLASFTAIRKSSLWGCTPTRSTTRRRRAVGPRPGNDARQSRCSFFTYTATGAPTARSAMSRFIRPPLSVDGRTLLYAIVHDVTDRKQAEQRLQRERTALPGHLRTGPGRHRPRRDLDGRLPALQRALRRDHRLPAGRESPASTSGRSPRRRILTRLCKPGMSEAASRRIRNPSV
jgi:hypothetical protein